MASNRLGRSAGDPGRGPAGLAGVRVEWAHLLVADFLLGDGVAVERKSARDFVASILDRRLFDQAERLLEAFERPLLILEGDPLDTEIGVHPNAVRGPR